jgi:hypothetical protein
MTDRPNPGSDAAVLLGCTCPVLDNGHGQGYMGQPSIYVYTAGCPIHWDEKDRNDANTDHDDLPYAEDDA